MIGGRGRVSKNTLTSRVKRLKERFPNAVGRALYQETEVEATEVKRRVPVLTGNLRASVHVVGPEFIGRSLLNAGRVRCMIVCGGVAAPYAIYVHENLHAFHKVGQAKFLESVILESRPYMLARVAARIKLNELLD